jgi:hypothetical protein
MSEYHEFRAIERPLTNKQVGELRRYSSRADITATSFSVEYNWGHFKGDPHQWMEKYFDAFVHVANWGTRWFMVRIPAHWLGLLTQIAPCIADPPVHEPPQLFRGQSAAVLDH